MNGVRSAQRTSENKGTDTLAEQNTARKREQRTTKNQDAVKQNSQKNGKWHGSRPPFAEGNGTHLQ